jgi:hypothetical protein
MQKPAHQDLSRQQLHELIWSKPSTEVAKELNISDVRLGKICNEQGVPKPPRGYWAKKAAGQDCPITPLPPDPKTASDRNENRWLESINPRTRKWLLEHSLSDLSEVLGLDLSGDIPWSIREDLGKFQYEKSLELGTSDPSEPLEAEEVQRRLFSGGLIFDGNDRRFFSLGRLTWEGSKVLCVRRGLVYVDELTENDKISSLKAFGTTNAYLMDKVHQSFGVRRKAGFRQWNDDVELSREIFGLEQEMLEKLTLAYEHAMLCSSPYRYVQITCSRSDNKCDLTGAYIPEGFPFIKTTETIYWGGHISLYAFYQHIALLTHSGARGVTATRLLEEAGIDETIWSILRNVGVDYRDPVQWNDVRRIKGNA